MENMSKMASFWPIFYFKGTGSKTASFWLVLFKKIQNNVVLDPALLKEQSFWSQKIKKKKRN